MRHDCCALEVPNPMIVISAERNARAEPETREQPALEESVVEVLGVISLGMGKAPPALPFAARGEG